MAFFVPCGSAVKTRIFRSWCGNVTKRHVIEKQQCEAITINRPDNIKYEDALNSEIDVEQLKIIAQFVIKVLKL